MPKASESLATLPPIAAEALRKLGENLAIARTRRKESQRTFPPFAASPAAAGCGRLSEDPSEWTDAQRLYAAEHEAYLTERLEPWKQERDRVAVELRLAVRTLWDPVRTVVIGGQEMVLGL